jgi:hypothetical protein
MVLLFWFSLTATLALGAAIAYGWVRCNPIKCQSEDVWFACVMSHIFWLVLLGSTIFLATKI